MLEMLIALVCGVVANCLSAGAGRAARILPTALRGSAMPIVTLTNGLRVGNFSSPHAFEFSDGTSLPACSAERARLSQLDTEEIAVAGRGIRIPTIRIKMRMSEQCRLALHEAQKADCDVIIVPRPVLDALKETGRNVERSKFRTCRLADRVKKLVCTDKFCA